MAYGTSTYGVGVYGVGDVDPPIPPEPPFVHTVTTARLGESGIVLNGGPDEYGVEWSWQAGTDPWNPGPQPREVRGPRGSANGDWSATRYYEGRVQELAVLVKAPSHEALHHAAQRWQTAISLEEFAFVVDEPFFGERVSVMARDGAPTFREETPGGPRGGAVARATCSLAADDPLIYGMTLRTASTGFPSTTGGLMWPTPWPATWDASVVSGLLRLTNAGSQRTPILWRIDGPVVDPMVTELATGRRFQLNLELVAGEWVTVDGATGRVLAQSDPQASRRSLFRGQWLDLPPGDHEFAFGGGVAGPDAQLTASWRDAWI